MRWAPTCRCDPARSRVHAPADLRARVRGIVISVLQEPNELRAVMFKGFPRSDPWTPKRWREVTGREDLAQSCSPCRHRGGQPRAGGRRGDRARQADPERIAKRIERKESGRKHYVEPHSNHSRGAHSGAARRPGRRPRGVVERGLHRPGGRGGQGGHRGLSRRRPASRSSLSSIPSRSFPTRSWRLSRPESRPTSRSA
jgi:hypothetical protein